MQELQSRKDIVITDASKRGAVVILDVRDYVKEAERQLNNYNPTTVNKETIHKFISKFKKKPTQ